MWRGVLELLFPGACARCGTAVGREALCPRCRLELLRLAPGFETAAPAPLESWVAAVSFEGEAAGWLRRFKYPDPGLFGLDPAAEAVAAALIEEAGRRAPGPAPDLIVPVPLHPLRLRQRGFNPAGLLAVALGPRPRASGGSRCTDPDPKHAEPDPARPLPAGPRTSREPSARGSGRCRGGSGWWTTW